MVRRWFESARRSSTTRGGHSRRPSGHRRRRCPQQLAHWQGCQEQEPDQEGLQGIRQRTAWPPRTTRTPRSPGSTGTAGAGRSSRSSRSDQRTYQSRSRDAGHLDCILCARRTRHGRGRVHRRAQWLPVRQLPGRRRRRNPYGLGRLGRLRSRRQPGRRAGVRHLRSALVRTFKRPVSNRLGA
jgi:hypothetical protein